MAKQPEHKGSATAGRHDNPSTVIRIVEAEIEKPESELTNALLGMLKDAITTGNTSDGTAAQKDLVNSIKALSGVATNGPLKAQVKALITSCQQDIQPRIESLNRFIRATTSASGRQQARDLLTLLSAETTELNNDLAVVDTASDAELTQMKAVLSSTHAANIGQVDTFLNG
ncbi:MAG TPA: hypothetical protein VE988_30230 [Gemmataceae bacterium]|nr:hypothetical protein [Gemmataceae bacterium]